MNASHFQEELEYYPCTYGQCRIPFRGPRVDLNGPYSVVLGGSDAFGRYVEDPFPERLAELTRRRVLNLGVLNGGADVIARDDHLIELVQGAEAIVIQATGAGNISNRFYSVHPRRNDRFLRHSVLMETLFPDVDFTDFSFTGHLLSTLRRHSPERFAIIAQELSEAWVDRMRLTLRRLPGRKILLWVENSSPFARPLGPEPLFVSVDMLQKLEPFIDSLVHVNVTDDQNEDQLKDMIFPEMERESAMHSLSPAGHERVARALARVVRRRNGLAA